MGQFLIWELMLTGKDKLRQEGEGDRRGRTLCAPGTALCILHLSEAIRRQGNVWSAQHIPQ